MAAARSHRAGDPFGAFRAAFPPEDVAAVDAAALDAEVAAALGVRVPRLLVRFWRQVGCGSFADGEFHVFGRARRRGGRDPLVRWNARPFWRELSPDPLPRPGRRGRLFFAETCFGDQLGLEYERGRCVLILFCPATMETYLLADSFPRLFTEVLTERHAVVEPSHLRAARKGAGPLPRGKWYCPAVSPLAGGSGRPGNWVVMSPEAFMACTIAEYQVLSILR